MTDEPSNVVSLKAWEVVEFPYFTAVRRKNGDWTNLFFKQSEQELDFEALGLRVELTDSSIAIQGRAGK